MQANDPAMLLDFSSPFDEVKLNMLEQTVSVMYSGNTQDVSLQSLYFQRII